jgi:hypothetical protein
MLLKRGGGALLGMFGGGAAAGAGAAAEGLILPAGAEAAGGSLLGMGPWGWAALAALIGGGVAFNVGGSRDWIAGKLGLGGKGKGKGAGAPVAGVPGGVAAALEAAATSSGVPLSLLQAVAKVESGFNPNAVSPAGAQGLMQIMPRTGSMLGLTNPFDPAQSASAGASYLSKLYRQYGDWRTALIAYNQGPGALQKYGAFPSAASYADKILRDSGRRAASSGKQEVNNNISLGGIYITKPNAEPHEIQSAVRDGVRDGLRSQTQFDMAQVAPAW